MTWPRAGTIALLVALLVAGCLAPDDAAPPAESAPNPFSSTPPESDVDVDTAALRALKDQAGIAACPRTEHTEPVEDGLPALTLPCLGGGRDVHLAGLEGPLVLNLWASWCAPCREELPVLQEYAERAAGQVKVVGVDYKDVQPGAALDLARRSGVTYPLVADLDAELRAPLRATQVPMTYLVGADGRIAKVVPGQIHSVDELDAAVEEALGVSIDG